jgi:hypothetical protein
MHSTSSPLIATPAFARNATASAPVRPRNRIMIAVLVVLVVAGGGAFIASLLGEIGLLRKTYMPNIFFYLFGTYEPAMLWLLGGFAALTGGLAVVASRDATVDSAASAATSASIRMRHVWLVALGVLVVTGAGAWLVLHAFPLAMDEYMAGFEARILLSGRLRAPVPNEWWPHVRAIAPIFSGVGADHTWYATYLPVYAAIRAVFVAINLEALANPVLAAFSVVLLALIGQRLWPDRPARTWFAVAALVLSAQFLITSMTGYAMPAHLCLNVVWLWLYLREDRLSNAMIPWHGVAALALHNPFPHADFVAPFLLRTLLRRRFALLAYWGVVYGAGSFLWLRFLQSAYAAAASSSGSAATMGGFLSSFQAPDRMQALVQSMNLAMVLDWQTPLVALSFVVAICAWRRMTPTLRDVALGFFLTFALYVFFPATQGHGWGYRYIYGSLGNVALLAAFGLDEMAILFGAARLRLLATASVGLTLGLQLTLRAMAAERFTRPYARAAEWVAAQPADVVVVPTHTAWYASDLVRNDPLFRTKPIVAAMRGMTREEAQFLERRYPGRVRFVRPEELWLLGMPPLDPPFGPGKAESQ